jgi:cell division protease FtsH
MSKKLGPLTYGKRQQLAYLNIEGTEERNFSEETARLIDSEVRELIEEGQRRAREILTERRATLDEIARILQDREVVSGEEIKEIIHRMEPRVESPSRGTAEPVLQ